jgi:hypothetical protein
MARFNTKEELGSYILRQLGDGVIDQEVTDQHVEDAIDDAIDYYFEKSGVSSLEEKVLIFQASGINEIKLPDDVESVLDIMSPVAQSSFFTQQYYQDSMYYLRENVGSMRFDLTSYYLFNQYIDTMNILFQKKYVYKFNRTNKLLTLNPTPFGTVAVKYYSFNERYSPEILSNSWIKRFSTELLRRVWGTILSKYSGKIVTGGVEIDGASILSLANEEIEKLKAEFDTTYNEPIDFIMA